MKKVLKYFIFAILFLSCGQYGFTIEENAYPPPPPMKGNPPAGLKQNPVDAISGNTFKKVKKNFFSKAVIVEYDAEGNEVINPLYPKKYNRAYINEISSEYSCTGKEEIIYVALDILKGTGGEFSRKALLGNNLTLKPVRIEFKDLNAIDSKYGSFDALGWKKGEKLFIYINPRHKDAPAVALSALLSHEALHQDEYNSLKEETYAWTMEAAVWCELLELYPDTDVNLHPLVTRESTLKKLFERGEYTDKYIRKTVYSNAGYKELPETSPGFEDL